MTRASTEQHGGATTRRSPKRLTRTAIVILSVLGLSFAAHGIYRALQISDPEDTVQPVPSTVETSSPRVVSEKISMPGESQTTAPPTDAAGREASPSPEKSAIPMSEPTEPIADQMASAPGDGTPDTESVAMGWSAEPLPITQSPEAPSEPWDAEIQRFLVEWISAWENSAGPNNDMETYMSFYAVDFQARGMDKTAWKKDKQNKHRKKRWIDIQLSEIIIQELDDQNAAEVSFLQNYRSSNYSSTAPKTLILRRVKTGWKITGMRE